MKKTLLILIVLASSIYAREYKVIYNVTTSNEITVEKSLLNSIAVLKEHYKTQGDSLDAVVIISGGSYRYFRQDIKNNLYPKIVTLVESGVKFEVCSMGMKKRDITKVMLYPFVTPVFNRTASLIEWQSRGYSLVNVE